MNEGSEMDEPKPSANCIDVSQSSYEVKSYVVYNVVYNVAIPNSWIILLTGAYGGPTRVLNSFDSSCMYFASSLLPSDGPKLNSFTFYLMSL